MQLPIISRSFIAYFLALFICPVVPAALVVFAMKGYSLGFFGFIYFFGFLAMLFICTPLFLVFLYLNKLNPWTVIAGGLGGGAAVAFIVRYPSLVKSTDLLAFCVIGLVMAFVFWIIWSLIIRI